MWLCPKCETENSDWNKKCDKCAYKRPIEHANPWKVLLGVSITSVFIAIILWLTLGFGLPEKRVEEEYIPVYVEISDPGIEKAIRNTLEKPEGQLTERELLDMSLLNAEKCGVKSLEDLSKLPNLQHIFLQGNGLTDISGVACLKELVYLNIDENEVSDISVILELPKLIELSASHNNITDISPLAGQTRFLRLYLDDNSLKDISPLADLYKLIIVWLSDNQIEDWTPMLNKEYLKELLVDGKYYSGATVYKLVEASQN